MWRCAVCVSYAEPIVEGPHPCRLVHFSGFFPTTLLPAGCVMKLSSVLFCLWDFEIPVLFLEPSPSFSLSSCLSCKFRSHSFQESLSGHLFVKDSVLPGSDLEVEALSDNSLLGHLFLLFPLASFILTTERLAYSATSSFLFVLCFFRAMCWCSYCRTRGTTGCWSWASCLPCLRVFWQHTQTSSSLERWDRVSFGCCSLFGTSINKTQ